MTAGTFRFHVGEFECIAISDGALNYPPESLFANAPLERVEETLRGHDLSVDQVTTPYSDLGAHADEVFPGLDH